jgi:hypothetical protein
MCLRFGSDPRRDFLSTETPRRKKTVDVGKVPDVAAAAGESPDHFDETPKQNCSNEAPTACVTVKK